MNPSKLSALTLALLAVHAAADSPADTVHNQDGELQTVHVSGKKKLKDAYTVSPPVSSSRPKTRRNR